MITVAGSPGVNAWARERARKQRTWARATSSRWRISTGKLLLALIVLSPMPALANDAPATVREHLQTFKTYPFSDPDPVPSMGGEQLYPYFRFDGFTDKAEDRQWKVVELENKYLRVLVMPEIGGKIWAAIDKASGKSFIYYNHVVKFRDVALRGPWTSGGIEINYGIIGHAASSSTPVNYLTRQNPDGSASCFVGGLDMLSHTQWRLEINLPRDKACFITRSFWHNGTEVEQPYYSWMNGAVRAADDLQLIYPGTHYIGHLGEHSTWPTSARSGKDLS